MAAALTLRWLLAQALGAPCGPGEGEAEAHGGGAVERHPDRAEIFDRRVDDEPLASLDDLARGPRLVRRKVQSAAAGPQGGFEHGHRETERVVEWKRVFVDAKPQADFTGRQGGDVNFRLVGHARLLSRDAFLAKVNKAGSPVYTIARGPFETPPVKGAADLSRQARAKQTDPARVEAERLAKAGEAQKLGRAIQITDRRGQP